MNIWVRFGVGLVLAAVMSLLVFLPVPDAPDRAASIASLVFDVDPLEQTVTIPLESEAAWSDWGLATSVVQAHDGSRLVHSRLSHKDLRQSDFSYQFSSPDLLTIRSKFTNLSVGVGYVPGSFYHLPFEFRTTARTRDIDRANTDGPGLSMAGLLGVGGVTPGVLDPQETSATQTFLVDHQGVPFSFVVDAFADVH